MKKRQVQAGYWLRMAVITAWMALAAGCSHMQEPEVLGKLETFLGILLHFSLPVHT